MRIKNNIQSDTHLRIVTDLSTLVNGDCLASMSNIPDKSVDLIITDPPYNLGLCQVLKKVYRF